ncbi:uncharacterized protein FIBRA_00122 [Fibroporia radiculosa]|uniref:H/ACA ribonucleoprotein complex non-core subunit NAF1 n=1 Tax=Fibroporia radiculosa TaxID=599839 RepID=J7SCH1_9APHY|nr:uncharacterized protein FIBRA_00122 [Fibroporia radiculosa]CCL98128.1 predicted protein [Fibroporia radiculosa]
MASTFKLPSIIPQDLQLIHNLVGEIASPPSRSQPPPSTQQDDDIQSSDDDSDSEREVEAGILKGLEDDEAGPTTGNSPSESMSSDSDSSSDADSEGEAEPEEARPSKLDEVDLDEEEAGQAVTSETQVRTKNEIAEAQITIPDIEEIGFHEKLEKVGEVMSIVDKVVIVKGCASEFANRASERALDSDTLLVFEDRKVLGYIYETFGPTTQPLYQIKFTQQYPLDPEKVRLSRPVFHVPERSNFIFVRQLQRLKGSDASNVHDEEPADDELEFSDDEAEAAYKRAATKRREQSRARSVVSSRQATPSPAQMRDQDMVDELYGESPYDQPGPYNDIDLGVGPSRALPIPYDDPYSDNYAVPDTRLPPSPTEFQDVNQSYPTGSHSDDVRGHGRGRGRGGTSGRYNDRARGRGRDRRRHDRGRARGRGRDDRSYASSGSRPSIPQPERYGSYIPRPLSPTSLAIARATGQYPDGHPMSSTERESPALSFDGAGGQGYSQPSQQQFMFGFQNQYVQPHINPRFASSFGMHLGFQQETHQAAYSYGETGYGGGADHFAASWRPDWNVNQSGYDNASTMGPPESR